MPAVLDTLDIKIVVSCDDGDTIAFYVVGHYPATAFLRALRNSPEIVDEDVLLESAVYHERWRKVPYADYGGMRMWRGNGPGSFPVTGIDLREWER